MSNEMGTHMGHLTPEQRAIRAVKNQRNLARVHPVGSQHGLNMPEAGSNHRIHSQLFVRGNKLARGGR